jgi:sporulation protein YqfC
MKEKEGGSSMRKWRQNIKKWVTNKLELPEDVLMDLPRITMIGQLHIYIENHYGVLQFSDQVLRLRLRQGHLLIKGNGFVLKILQPEELLLEGKIDKVYFVDQE